MAATVDLVPARTYESLEDNLIESENSEVEESNFSTIPSSEPSTTHDISRVKYRIKNLASFATWLEESANRTFPNRHRYGSRYYNVKVLLLRWAEDNLERRWELHDLEKLLQQGYGFDTETWLIPSQKSHLELMTKACRFVEEHESEDCLIILYYGGYATTNSARQATWSCKRDLKYASLDWSAIQTLFEDAISDVLLLLDCCAATPATPIPGRSITETIAAYGWDLSTPKPSRQPFTNVLIEVLRDWKGRDKGFSVSMLHCEMLSRLKLNGGRTSNASPAPLHIVTTANPTAQSITLSRRQPQPEARGRSHTPSESTRERGDGASLHAEQLSSSIENLGIGKLELIASRGEFKVPHVIISVALEEDQGLDTKSCSEWLESFPALARYAKVEGIYKSYSILLIVSLPVSIWNLLPDHPACSFVGYALSDNLLTTQRNLSSRTDRSPTHIGRSESQLKNKGKDDVFPEADYSSKTTEQSSTALAVPKIRADVQGAPPTLIDAASQNPPSAFSNWGNLWIGLFNLRMILRNYWRVLLRPQVPEGYGRIEWNCDCGMQLYGDFDQSSHEEFDRLKASLQGLENSKITKATPPGPFPDSNNVQTQSFQQGIEITMPPQTHLRASHHPIPSSISDPRSQVQDLQTISSFSVPNVVSPLPQVKKYLGLCINTGEFCRSLGEVALTNILRDSDLFIEVALTYKKIRGFRAEAFKFFMLKPKAVRFVQFSVEELVENYRVNVFDESPSIPPETEVKLHEYHYEPCPLKTVPPISSDAFLHYLSSPKCVSHSVKWLNRLPKKLNLNWQQQVQRRTDSAVDIVGWGVHIIEGANLEAISLVVLSILIFTGVVSLMWAKYYNDISGGFTIGAYLVAVLTAWLSLVFFQCTRA